MRKLKQPNTTFSNFLHSKQQILIVFLLAALGMIMLALSIAATPTASIEPETGNMAGNVSIENDPSFASGAGYIKFGQPAYTDMFVSTSGNDFNSGASPALAVRTLARAVQLSGPNTRIRILAGTYIEQVSVKKNNLIIEPYGNGDVTINGAMPDFLSSVDWQYVQPGIYKKTINRDEYRSDGANTLYDKDGQQQWTYPDAISFANQGIVSRLPPGIFINSADQSVYVSTDTGEPPTAPLYIGGLYPTLFLDGASNITVRSIGNSKLKLMYGSYNVYAKNANNIRVDDVDITGGRSAVLAYDTSNMSVTNSTLRGTFNRDWDWTDVKEGNSYNSMENQAILVRAIDKDMTGIVVDNNDMSGYFNGVVYDDAMQQHFIDNSVISRNIIHDSSDDGIEIDARYHNLVVKGNTVYDVYSPFSSTGDTTGPVDVYENLFVANRVISYSHHTSTAGPYYAIKMNNNNTSDIVKNIHFYNNTFYFAGGNTLGRKTVQSNADSLSKNVTFINNIFYSYQGGIIRGTGRPEDNVEWDGNIFYSEVNVPYNYYAWNAIYDANHTYPSLSAILGAGAMPTQWQGNIEGNPSFNCVVPTNSGCFRPGATITKPASKQQIPTSFSESARLNSRTRIGAFE